MTRSMSSPEIRSPWWGRNSGARVDAQDFRDVRPRVAGADPNFEGVARLHGVDAALRQHAPVEEGVAGPIREFDEPKAFLGGEPFDNPTDRGTGRYFERLAEPGSGSKGTEL